MKSKTWFSLSIGALVLAAALPATQALAVFAAGAWGFAGFVREANAPSPSCALRQRVLSAHGFSIVIKPKLGMVNNNQCRLEHAQGVERTAQLSNAVFCMSFGPQISN